MKLILLSMLAGITGFTTIAATQTASNADEAREQIRAEIRERAEAKLALYSETLSLSEAKLERLKSIVETSVQERITFLQSLDEGAREKPLRTLMLVRNQMKKADKAVDAQLAEFLSEGELEVFRGMRALLRQEAMQYFISGEWPNS